MYPAGRRVVRRILKRCRKYCQGCCLLSLPDATLPSPHPAPSLASLTHSLSRPFHLYYIRSVTPKHKAAVRFLLRVAPRLHPKLTAQGHRRSGPGLVLVRSGLRGRGLTPNWDEDTLERVTALPLSSRSKQKTYDIELCLAGVYIDVCCPP